MDESPVFFIPNIHPENEETIYAGFAQLCGVTAPKLAERVFSVTFIHNSEEWTATVGENLRGIRRKPIKSKGRNTVQNQELSDQATVLAIFPGSSFYIFTNLGLEQIHSKWGNPVMADPKSVKLFSVK